MWEETEVDSTGCGESYESLKILVKWESKEFVVESRKHGWPRGEILGALRRWLSGEFSGQVWGF